MNTKRAVQTAVLLGLALVGPAVAGAAREHPLEATVQQLLDLDVRPFAIAHRGFGANPGMGRRRPAENTVAAVRAGFSTGATVVEVDVQLTRDGRVALFHEDFLPDGTCLNALSLAELQARLPFVPALEDVLEVARRYNQATGPLRGLMIVELKAAAPFCDPDDSTELAIVSAATQVIRGAQMTEQVLLTSFSPALLDLAERHAPEIRRILAVSVLQFLTKEEVEAILHLTVTPIDKENDLGLQWAEIGGVFRLPGYRSVAELVQTAAFTYVAAVEADLLLLHSTGAPLVQILRAVGLKVFGWTANDEDDWDFLASLGVDGIYVNNVPLGVRDEAAIP